jgi:hypothetical protein
MQLERHPVNCVRRVRSPTSLRKLAAYHAMLDKHNPTPVQLSASFAALARTVIAEQRFAKTAPRANTTMRYNKLRVSCALQTRSWKQQAHRVHANCVELECSSLIPVVPAAKPVLQEATTAFLVKRVNPVVLALTVTTQQLAVVLCAVQVHFPPVMVPSRALCARRDEQTPR